MCVHIPLNLQTLFEGVAARASHEFIALAFLGPIDQRFAPRLQPTSATNQPDRQWNPSGNAYQSQTILVLDIGFSNRHIAALRKD
jgi:hypothetical protein